MPTGGELQADDWNLDDQAVSGEASTVVGVLGLRRVEPLDERHQECLNEWGN